MRIEDRLRDAMRAEADTVEPAPEAWGRLQSRFRPTVPRNRRRRWPIAVAVAAAVAVAGVAAAVIVDDDETGPRVETPATTPGETAMPSEIVAIDTVGRLVVLSSDDGRERRELVSDVIADGGVSVSPAGQVYFTNDGPLACDSDLDGAPDRPVREVYRLDQPDAQPHAMTGAADFPAAGPREYSLTSIGDPCSGNVGQILVQNGTDANLPKTYPVASEGQLVMPPAWSPDGTLISTGTYADARRSVSILDVAAGSMRQLPLDGSTLDVAPWPAEFISNDEVMIVGAPKRAGRYPVLAVDVATGGLRRRLFTFASDAPPLDFDYDVQSHTLLIVTADRFLFRWRAGEEPVRIPGGFRAAAWIPATAARITSDREATACSASWEACIVVLNGSGVPDAAGAMSEQLRGLGYDNQEFIGNALRRTQTVVQCLPGVGTWGEQLARDVGPNTAHEEALELGESAGQAVCAVILGSGGPL